MAKRHTRVGKPTAVLAATATTLALRILERWQKRNPYVADYRVEDSLQRLRRASRLLDYLAKDIDPEGDAARARLAASGFFNQD